MDLKSKIILIYGPTASGKSKFAVKLAKKIGGEIINADSMQVYKELKILTARPFTKEYDKIKHHYFGFKNVKTATLSRTYTYSHCKLTDYLWILHWNRIRKC